MLVYNLNRYYFYVEGGFFLVHGWVGSFKSRCPLWIYLVFEHCFVSVGSLPFIHYSKLWQIAYSKLIFSQLSHVNYAVLYGSFTKLRIRGRGYKMIKDVNNIVLRLGYSHKIAYLISMPVLFVPRKRYKRNVPWRFFGLCSSIVRTVCYVVHSFRKPDIYCKLGIYLYGNEVFFKQGVKPYRL